MRSIINAAKPAANPAPIKLITPPYVVQNEPKRSSMVTGSTVIGKYMGDVVWLGIPVVKDGPDLLGTLLLGNDIIAVNGRKYNFSLLRSLLGTRCRSEIVTEFERFRSLGLKKALRPSVLSFTFKLAFASLIAYDELIWIGMIFSLQVLLRCNQPERSLNTLMEEHESNH